jgi:hypothetical protein
MELQDVIELYKEDIRWVQENRRGLGIGQQGLYKTLDKLGIKYGERYKSPDGVFRGGGHKSDMGVRRDLFRESTYFWFQHEELGTIFLPSERQLWDEVVREFRRKRITEILLD